MIGRQLTSIKGKTESAASLGYSGWWVGGVAGERQVQDDIAAGRLEWHGAHHSAESGLEALGQGDADMAASYLHEAIWQYIAALEKRVRSSDMEVLARSPGKRGRKKQNLPKEFCANCGLNEVLHPGKSHGDQKACDTFTPPDRVK